jgi:hypothetical protein
MRFVPDLTYHFNTYQLPRRDRLKPLRHGTETYGTSGRSGVGRSVTPTSFAGDFERSHGPIVPVVCELSEHFQQRLRRRPVRLRRGTRWNCSPYCRTIAAAGSNRMPTPPRSSRRLIARWAGLHGLTAGGNAIRTIGPSATVTSSWRGCPRLRFLPRRHAFFRRNIIFNLPTFSSSPATRRRGD